MGMTGRILGRLLPVLLAAVLAGCSKEREIPSPDDGAVTVRLVLNMPSPRAGGTAEPDAEPEGNATGCTRVTCSCWYTTRRGTSRTAS